MQLRRKLLLLLVVPPVAIFLFASLDSSGGKEGLLEIDLPERAADAEEGDGPEIIEQTRLMGREEGKRRKRQQHARSGFKGCRKGSAQDDPTPETSKQSHLWQALLDARAQFLVAGPRSRPTSTYRNTSVVLHKQMFIQRNADGVAGYREGLPVRPLSTLAGAASHVLHLPEQLMNSLPQADGGWSFGSCAVVGNSGRLLHSNHGREIDEHDAVFRINYAPTDGFEKHVGRRTTFDVINTPHAKALASLGRGDGRGAFDPLLAMHGKPRDSTVVVFEVLNKHARPVYARLMEQYSAHKGYTQGRVVILSPELTQHSDSLFQLLRRQIQANTRQDYHSKAMSGWFATMMSLQMCSHTDIYGFSPFVSGEGHWHGLYHYFSSSVEPALQSHSFDMAYAALREVSMYPCSRLSLTVHLDN